MRRTFVGAVACCALILGATAPSSSADIERTCVHSAEWSIGATTATLTNPTNHTCYAVHATAGLDGVMPEANAGVNWNRYAQSTVVYNYTPINGACLGTLSLETPTRSYRGVLKNDGNSVATVTVVMTPKTTPATKIVAQYVAAPVVACASPINTTMVSSSSDTIP